MKVDDQRISEQLVLLETAIIEIHRLWANNYRFASEERLKSHLKKITGFQKIKGDYLKEQSRRFLNAAQTVINKGILQWQD